jgi:hypothetical protein
VKRTRLVTIVLALILATLGAGIGTAAAHASARPVRHATCKPGRTFINGYWRLRDNAFAGPSRNRFCITTLGVSVTVRSNAIPYGGNVVADPGVEFGPMFDWTDALTGLPLPITDIGPITFHVACRGRTAGRFLCDLDTYFRPHVNWTGHGTFELVIANRWQGFTPGGYLVKVHGVTYRFAAWMTRDPSTGYTWPIAVFSQLRQTTTARIRISRFIWYLRVHHVLPKNARFYQDSQYVPELWSGGKGLTVSGRATGLLPVIRDLAVPADN